MPHTAIQRHNSPFDAVASSEAIARCYHSLFIAADAPFAGTSLPESYKIDLAESEAAIEMEVEQRRLYALLYATSGDGGLFDPNEECSCV